MTAAAHRGLPAETPILAGMTDGCAAQISAGALAEGHWNSVLGTTLVLKGVAHRLLRDPEGAVYSHRHPDEGWLPGGASNVGAGALARHFDNRGLAELTRRGRQNLVETVPTVQACPLRQDLRDHRANARDDNEGTRTPIGASMLLIGITRKSPPKEVEPRGFEPLTFAVQRRRSPD